MNPTKRTCRLNPGELVDYGAGSPSLVITARPSWVPGLFRVTLEHPAGNWKRYWRLGAAIWRMAPMAPWPTPNWPTTYADGFQRLTAAQHHQINDLLGTYRWTPAYGVVWRHGRWLRFHTDTETLVHFSNGEWWVPAQGERSGVS